MNFAPVKKEFLRQDAERILSEEYITEADKKSIKNPEKNSTKLGGRNKNRPPNSSQAKRQCSNIARGQPCQYGSNCRYSHEIDQIVTKLKGNCIFSKNYSKCPHGPFCLFESHGEPDSTTHDSYDCSIANILSPETRKLVQNNKKSKFKKSTENDTKNSFPVETDKEPRQRMTIDWKDKLYLAPLTTVGNLPFRRICVGLGAQITCSEMAVTSSLLAGKQSEWALIKRHESEKIFGVQLCGGNADTMATCAKIFDSPSFSVDFLDVNVGCPIDCIFKWGSGSALLGRPNRLLAIVETMSQACGLPISVKMRTGISDSNNVVVSLVEKLKEAGKCSLFTVHGRSREQRYSKFADWSIVSSCVDAAGNIPLFGNGDVLSYSDYQARREQISGMAGIMIGRGALIKPWIFTEIAEQRDWDISSRERFEILEKFRDNALEHWGSDLRGVETSRKFLLEWLSFLHRYIPVGLLETLPQSINVRPPPYYGRDDLETLMASANCGDWIKISELLLGPVPDDFKFLPKHRANAYQPVSSVFVPKL